MYKFETKPKAMIVIAINMIFELPAARFKRGFFNCHLLCILPLSVSGEGGGTEGVIDIISTFFS